MEEENEPPLPGGGGGANTAVRRERRANRQAAHLQPREREFAGKKFKTLVTEKSGQNLFFLKI